MGGGEKGGFVNACAYCIVTVLLLPRFREVIELS